MKTKSLDEMAIASQGIAFQGKGNFDDDFPNSLKGTFFASEDGAFKQWRPLYLETFDSPNKKNLVRIEMDWIGDIAGQHIPTILLEGFRVIGLGHGHGTKDPQIQLHGTTLVSHLLYNAASVYVGIDVPGKHVWWQYRMDKMNDHDWIMKFADNLGAYNGWVR